MSKPTPMCFEEYLAIALIVFEYGTEQEIRAATQPLLRVYEHVALRVGVLHEVPTREPDRSRIDDPHHRER